MHLLNGFLFGFGFMCGLIIFFMISIMLIKIIKKSKNTHATAGIWREYLQDALANDDYAEASFVTELLSGKHDNEEVETPANYRVHVDRELSLDENSNIPKLKANVTYKIIKQKNGKSN